MVWSSLRWGEKPGRAFLGVARGILEGMEKTMRAEMWTFPAVERRGSFPVPVARAGSLVSQVRECHGDFGWLTRLTF